MARHNGSSESECRACLNEVCACKQMANLRVCRRCFGISRRVSGDNQGCTAGLAPGRCNFCAERHGAVGRGESGVRHYHGSASAALHRPPTAQRAAALAQASCGLSNGGTPGPGVAVWQVDAQFSRRCCAPTMESPTPGHPQLFSVGKRL
jgi:hypothetical protein